MTSRKAISLALIGLLAIPAIAHSEPKTFHDTPCTKDCGGHKAGYEWAQKKKVTKPEQCGGKSKSFVEGCRIWVKEHQAPSEAHSVDK